jgi:hypothetical protein
MLRAHGLFNLHHLQRVEDIRLANERSGFSSLLYRCTSPFTCIFPYSLTYFNHPVAWLTPTQIILFVMIYILYQFKFGGWNPLKWQRRASKELQIPRPQVATSVPRRGHLALETTDTLFTVGNLRQFGRWLWVWLK